MAEYVFRLGYRRLEWKCDSRNSASRRAAERFGFSAEGVFRQHMILKGENRDTAWYAMLDKDWPRLGNAFRNWLEPANFDHNGLQLRPLREVMALIVPISKQRAHLCEACRPTGEALITLKPHESRAVC